MPKQPTTYYRPENLADALQSLAKPDAKPMGGGVHLLAGDAPYEIVDLQKLGLGQIEQVNGALHVGATATLTEFATFLTTLEADDSPAALLQTAVSLAGPNTYRNAATPGGTIARRLPDSELLAALLVLDTTLTLRTPGKTEMTLVDYLSAPERPSGLITAVTVPWTDGRGSSHRVARTPKDAPIVSVTGWQPAGGPVRLAATGVAERPLRLTAAEAALADGLDEDTVAAAAAKAKAANSHPGDFRGDAAYRAAMAAVLTRRVLQDLTG